MALESLKKIEDALDHDDVTAYKANYEVFKGGLSRHEVAKYYDQWAETGGYDMVSKYNYRINCFKKRNVQKCVIFQQKRFFQIFFIQEIFFNWL